MVIFCNFHSNPFNLDMNLEEKIIIHRNRDGMTTKGETIRHIPKYWKSTQLNEKWIEQLQAIMLIGDLVKISILSHSHTRKARGLQPVHQVKNGTFKWESPLISVYFPTKSVNGTLKLEFGQMISEIHSIWQIWVVIAMSKKDLWSA